MSKLDILLSHLQQVKKTGSGRWKACCPAHDDRSPSMAIREESDGRILIHCFAGCGAQEIVESVGLDMGDLFPDDLDTSGNIFHGARRAFNARDAVEYMARSSLFVAACCVTLREQGCLPMNDKERLEAISGRLVAIADEVL